MHRRIIELYSITEGWKDAVIGGVVGLSALSAPISSASTIVPSATIEIVDSHIDLPEWEKKIIKEVADEYGLKGEARLLLYVIRKVENGGDGREFGVLHPQAQRYKGDKYKSFKLQAQWAAGTIKKRFDGDLKKFAERWAPIGAANDPKGLNKNWYKNALYYMNKWAR